MTTPHDPAAAALLRLATAGAAGDRDAALTDIGRLWQHGYDDVTAINDAARLIQFARVLVAERRRRREEEPA